VVRDLISLIPTYGVWLVAGAIAIECLCIPLPGETILVAAAVYAGSTHRLDIWHIVEAGIIGGVLGNAVAFWIGRMHGYRFLLRYLPESRLKIGQYLFLRYGVKVVFFARFLPLLRSVAGLLAGINRMPWRLFFIANVAGAVIWVGIDCAAAYFFGKGLTKLAAPVEISLGLAVAAIVVAGAVVFRRHEMRLSVEAEQMSAEAPRPDRSSPSKAIQPRLQG
jgi:membrane protein DedA with SNARE-associated domain